MGGGWTIEFTKPCNKRGEGLYTPQILLQLELLHEQCGDFIAPGTLFHLGGKTLQVCATNSTHGGTHNTSLLWHRMAKPRRVFRLDPPGAEPSEDTVPFTGLSKRCQTRRIPRKDTRSRKCKSASASRWSSIRKGTGYIGCEAQPMRSSSGTCSFSSRCFMGP